ncbi:capsular biosynthesis protein [Limnohabitans sp. WS1]|uniref:capsular biosynthesis protein n=1 Tax=Limnohabitans sp. WS1 TaxID=1100726 RepID=UPI000D3376E9|nr:capsular biosynthesis protein [Limnohabitans sp. WS1]PUE13574.1 capsule polysaccharide biosynthesis [Limnohabitans sp. WS1]
MKFEKVSSGCNPALLRLNCARSVLLLQGPVGAFFDRLATWLMQQGAQVRRVAFQGGDLHDSQVLEPIAFKQALHDWPAFFGQLLHTHQVDCVVLFGQSRKYHHAAIELCKSQGIDVVVLEEGYFRPGFITMELGGVNGFSQTLERYQWAPLGQAGSIVPDISPSHFQKMAWQASLHYQAMWQARHEFELYQHHRISDPRFYAHYWIRSWLRKLTHLHPSHRLQRHLFAHKASRPYFFVPLQHDGDAQIVHHSDFANNAEFVIRVMESFAQHAPAHSLLVFRQHPHVRGGPGHGELIAGLAQELGMAHRVHHMVEGDTPDLAQHSAGVVLINSTVGLQALERGAPLMVLGQALYKQPQLSFTGELDQFWTQGRPACLAETQKFLAQMKNLTQVPASVYALRAEPLRWHEVLARDPAPHPAQTPAQAQADGDCFYDSYDRV